MPANQFEAVQPSKQGSNDGKPSLDKADTWLSLIQLAHHLCDAQLDALAARLAHALFSQSEDARDAKDASLYFHGAQLLKASASSFHFLASAAIKACLTEEAKLLQNSDKPQVSKQGANKIDSEMSLVSYEEMELKLSFGRASRTLELTYAEPLAALNMRLACLMEVDNISGAQNPFRPEVYLRALNTAWCEFNTDVNSHMMVLPLLSDILFELAPIYHAINESLVAKGILPDLQESYRLKRKQASIEAARVGEAVKNEVTKKLEQYFSEQGSGGEQPGSDGASSNANYGASSEGHLPGLNSGSGNSGVATSGDAQSYNPANSELFHYLADVQKNMAIHQLVAGAQNAMRLSHLRQEAPNMFRSGVEKHTFELLSRVFEGVFGNQEIPDPIKDLIGVLQVPVLKAALIDKEFFFKDSHPARRLIEMLSQYSASWDPEKGEDDPLFQAMQRNVIRVQKEFDQQLGLFDEVVSDLENFISKDEAATIEALQAPINRALQKEKFKQATLAATNDVSMRIGTGEVVAFVETFLENRWTKVLTLAYSVQDTKPHAVSDAIKTMDDLIWSIKPKITLAQRQEMINRLPGILARLNKWLSLIKWEDADRVQFFADLAECHASIVRAPLELSPERQMEIAVEAAKLATERRLEKRKKAEADERAKKAEEAAEKTRLVVQAIEKAKAQALVDKIKKVEISFGEAKKTELPPTEVTASKAEMTEEAIVAAIEQDIENAVSEVANLERGVWVQFIKRDDTVQKVRLAWISPMRSLFIFTSSQKEKSFSVAVDELERNFRDKRAHIVTVDKVVDRALMQALNDPKMEKSVAA